MSDERLTITVAEAASMLGISRSAAYDYIRAGELPAIRMGRRWLVPMRALTTMLDAAEAA